MPSHTKGQPMPGFLGGSDLAVPAQSANQAAAVAWIADYTDTTSEQALAAKGNIPNATNLLSNSVNDRAAARSWFVPQAVNWVDVENGNILKTMLSSFLTGQLTVNAGREGGKPEHRTNPQPAGVLIKDAPTLSSTAATERSRRWRLTRRRVARGATPYLLIAPAIRHDRGDPRLPDRKSRSSSRSRDTGCSS